jgi:alpha-beta hydrolase superfamily lysophospholipase
MKTYVLVNGAWAGKFAWSQIAPSLEKEGHKLVTLDLPGHGEEG